RSRLRAQRGTLAASERGALELVRLWRPERLSHREKHRAIVTMRPPGIAVTGVGCVSPLGIDHEQHFQRLYAGEAAIGSRRLWSSAGHTRLNFFTAVDRFVCSEHVQTRMLRKVLRPWA